MRHNCYTRGSGVTTQEQKGTCYLNIEQQDKTGQHITEFINYNPNLIALIKKSIKSNN